MKAQDLIRSYREKKKQRNQTAVFANLNVGAYLIVPILLGVFIGYQLDSRLKTKPLFLIVFLLLGTVSTFYNLIKLTKEQ